MYNAPLTLSSATAAAQHNGAGSARSVFRQFGLDCSQVSTQPTPHRYGYGQPGQSTRVGGGDYAEVRVHARPVWLAL